jgi:hypothetical protein
MTPETEGAKIMFGRKKGPSQPTGPFAHAHGCKLVVADPGFEPEWQEIETGHWRRECQCTPEDRWEAPVDRRPRLDPLDPSTFRHAPSCELRDVSDPALLRAIVEVKDGTGGGYWWVSCHACATSWQLPYYAAESVQ